MPAGVALALSPNAPPGVGDGPLAPALPSIFVGTCAGLLL